MTLHDTEVIELLADEPELLAIADAVSATQEKPKPSRSRRRRFAVRGGIVAGLAAAAIVAILAAPQGGPSGVLGRALAAIGDGRIMHVVTESPSGLVYVDLKTGHRTVQTFREELWVDRQFDHFHVILSLNGRVFGDVLYPQDAKNGVMTPNPSSNPAFVALWTGYRAALRNGTVTLAGRGTVRGRAVYWLRFKPTSQVQGPTEVAVDARTYKPVLWRIYANGRHLDIRILVAKAIAYAPSEFQRRGPSLAGGNVVEGSSSSVPVNPSAPGSTVVRAPWLTAGKTAAGLKLRSASQLTETSNFRGKRTTIHGLELTYGSVLNGGPLSTTVDELRRPDAPNAWSHIPAGSIQVQIGTESSTKGGTHTTWTGTLKKEGLYITISTAKSERALLEIARALHPGRR